MPSTQKETVLADLDFASDRLSTQVRQLALGELALVWALLVGEKQDGLPLQKVWLIRIAFLSLTTMALDFCQYIAAYLASRRAWEDLRAGGDGQYDRKSLAWYLRSWCFGAKLFVCSLSVVLVLWVLGGAVVELRWRLSNP